jgi:hypothetical protein
MRRYPRWRAGVLAAGTVQVLAARSLARTKPIADTHFSDDESGLSRIGLQLLTEIAYAYAQGPAVVGLAGAPHLADELLLFHDGAEVSG